MNKCLSLSMILSLVLISSCAHAYMFRIENYTSKNHTIFIRFAGFAGLGEDEEGLGNVSSKFYDKKAQKMLPGVIAKSFGGWRVGQCARALRVGDKVPAIFSVSGEEFSRIVSMAADDSNFNLVKYLVSKGIAQTQMGDMHCFNRVFALFMDGDSNLVIITTVLS